MLVSNNQSHSAWSVNQGASRLRGED